MPGSVTSDCGTDPDLLRDLQVLLECSLDPRRVRGGNMTACVLVPSSEHVAEIVGRQGCRIKALRVKTNTYIKTPVRGAEPVFVVTGRGEDVAAARREIISAAEHFTAIRSCGPLGRPGLPTGPPGWTGLTMVLVRVPNSFVGLVIGPKGATIKRIQQLTHTSISTPGRNQEPVFEVRGMPENVDQAREEIQAHIAQRTGAPPELQDRNDFAANGTETGLWSRPGSGASTEWERNRNGLSFSGGSSSTDSPDQSPMGWW